MTGNDRVKQTPPGLFWGITAWLGLLLWVVYGRVLRYPFFSDDFFQLPFLDTHSLSQLWRTSGGFFFFRPLAFTLWKLLAWLSDGYPPALFHVINLLLHWANSVLVAWLTVKLWPSSDGQPDWRRGFIAATLFLLYPFSYEAVAWVAAVMHPQFLLLTLLSIAGYLKMEETAASTKKIIWGGFSLLMALLSPFAHENGTLVAPLIIIAAWTHSRRTKVSRWHTGRMLFWFLPPLIWYLVWRQAPAQDGASNLAVNGLETIWQNSLYFLQGTAYPLSWLGGRWRDNSNLDPFIITAVLSLTVLSLAILVQWRTGFTGKDWLPWLWTAVSAAPAILFLPFLHVSAAPRMLMLPSVGIVWLWTDVIWRIVDRQWPSKSRMRLGFVFLFSLALLGQNISFIRSQLYLYDIGSSAIWNAVSATNSANKVGETAVFINFPSWFAPEQATFAIGQEGDIVLLWVDQLDEMIWAHTGEIAAITAVRYDDIRQSLPYHTGPVGTGPDWAQMSQTRSRVFRCFYTNNSVQMQPAGDLSASVPDEVTLAIFNDAVRLLAATAEISGQDVNIHMTWQVRLQPPSPVTVFVHVLNQHGQLIGQTDGDPIAGTFAFWQWATGQVITDHRTVKVDETPISIQVGLYDRVSGERLTAVSANGDQFASNAFPIPIDN